MDNKHCYGCKYLDRYYTKVLKRFDQTQFGWCGVKQANVNAHEGCDKYAHKTYPRIARCSARICLSDILTELSALRNILEEEQREQDV